MPVTVSEKWSGGQYQRGISAVRTFTVHGVANADQAASAVDEATGLAVPQAGVGHPLHPLIFAQTPIVKTVELGFYEVTVNYAKPGTITPGQEEEDPLLQPAELAWEITNTSEPVDVDGANGPIINSARDPFETPAQIDVASLILTITKNEPSFNPALSLPYQNRVNAAGFAGWGRGLVRCLGIGPARPYHIGDSFVPVSYRFEFRPDGFWHFMVDQGFRGWYVSGSSKKLGDFYQGKDRAQKPVPLNGRLGMPFDSTAGFMVTEALKGPTAAPTQGWSSEVVPELRAGFYVLKFPKYPYANFSALGLGL